MTARAERRLAAILAGDIVGYSRLMGADEEGTLARINAVRREFWEPKIAEHRGRIVKRTGDGVLIEFASAVDAARYGIEIQRGMAKRNAEVPEDKRIDLRMGIHIGDILIEDDDIFGDGVNVAARLEGIAEPGGICFSRAAFEQVDGKLDVSFEDGGDQQLKNIGRPVRVYRANFTAVASAPVLALTLPDKPSIAVLPFQNMTGDPDQDYFVDGMVEEITTAISRLPWLFVIARNSSFTYKGRAVDVKQVARELGVRYVLEGSVRKASNRVRITGQLIDTTTGAHIWADHFDGALDDIFELQDQVASTVIGAIEPKLQKSEIERVTRKPTTNLTAYDLYLRALAQSYRNTEEGVAEAVVLARQALEAERDDAETISQAAWTLFRLAGEAAMAAAALDRALTLNPNAAHAWLIRGHIHALRNQPEAAIEAIERARRLSPFDPLAIFYAVNIAIAHLSARRFEQAIEWADRTLHEHPRHVPAIRVKVAANAHLGHLEE